MHLQKTANCQDVIELAKENQCEFLDLKFTDLFGAWQHLTLTIGEIKAQLFSHGVGFDGSSIRGFQKLENSDMVSIPDAATAFLDPVCDSPTISLICDIKDPFSEENYSRDSRCVARKAEAYLKNSGICDVSYWGPELEFFVFNNVSFASNNHESFYHINAREGGWNCGEDENSEGDDSGRARNKLSPP